MTTPNEPDRYATRASIFVRLNDANLREMAWEEFYEKYSPMIAGSARRLGARSNEVDDVVAEVIGGFYEASPQFTYDPADGKTFRGYLKTCTFRTLRKHIRKGQVAGQAPGDIADSEVHVDHVWEDVWEKELLRKAYKRVGERYKNNVTFQAFTRVVLNGEEVKLAAQELGMTEESVYKAKQRVAAAMSEELAFLRKEVG